MHSTSLFAQFRPTSYSTQTGTKPTETFSRFAGLYICIFFHDGSFRVVSRVIFFQNVCIFARIEVWEIFIAVMTAVYLLIEMHQAFSEVSYLLIRLAFFVGLPFYGTDDWKKFSKCNNYIKFISFNFFFLTISFLFSFVASLLPFTKGRALGPGEGHGREKKSSIAIVIVISRPSKKLKNVRVVCDRTQVILFKMQICDNHDLVIVWFFSSQTWNYIEFSNIADICTFSTALISIFPEPLGLEFPDKCVFLVISVLFGYLALLLYLQRLVKMHYF